MFSMLAMQFVASKGGSSNIAADGKIDRQLCDNRDNTSDWNITVAWVLENYPCDVRTSSMRYHCDQAFSSHWGLANGSAVGCLVVIAVLLALHALRDGASGACLEFLQGSGLALVVAPLTGVVGAIFVALAVGPVLGAVAIFRVEADATYVGFLRCQCGFCGFSELYQRADLAATWVFVPILALITAPLAVCVIAPLLPNDTPGTWISDGTQPHGGYYQGADRDKSSMYLLGFLVAACGVGCFLWEMYMSVRIQVAFWGDARREGVDTAVLVLLLVHIVMSFGGCLWARSR
jgi:hypothetical protein